MTGYSSGCQHRSSVAFASGNLLPRLIGARKSSADPSEPPFLRIQIHGLGKIDIEVRAGDIHDRGRHHALRETGFLSENRTTVPSAS